MNTLERIRKGMLLNKDTKEKESSESTNKNENSGIYFIKYKLQISKFSIYKLLIFFTVIYTILYTKRK